MEDLTYYIAIVVVIIVGIIIIKRVSSCLWNIVVGGAMLALLAWALMKLGVI